MLFFLLINCTHSFAHRLWARNAAGAAAGRSRLSLSLSVCLDNPRSQLLAG